MEIGTRKRILRIGFFLLVFSFVFACAFPVRQVYKVDEFLPIGNIQGDSFIGQRFPFRIKIPPGWQASTRYPEFLVEQGYDREELNKTPFFLFNPQSKSNLQIDFSPAGRTVRFDQETIEALANMGGGSVTSELQEEYGKDLQVEISKPALVQLKGVPYAARQSARYVLKGNPWERGWIYAFAEPFQIFIFYLVTGENVKADKDIIGQALSSFEYLGIR